MPKVVRGVVYSSSEHSEGQDSEDEDSATEQHLQHSERDEDEDGRDEDERDEDERDDERDEDERDDERDEDERNDEDEYVDTELDIVSAIDGVSPTGLVDTSDDVLATPGLNMDRRNVAKRAQRWETRLEMIENGDGDVPKSARDEMKRMRDEAEADWRRWQDLIGKKASLQALLNDRFARAQLAPIALPACFEHAPTKAFFSALAANPFAPLQPHIVSGALLPVLFNAKPDRRGFCSIYVRVHETTVKAELSIIAQLDDDHPQDAPAGAVFRLEVDGMLASDEARQLYIGGTDPDGDHDKVNGIAGRYLADMQAASSALEKNLSGGSRIINYCQLTNDNHWRLYELPALRVKVDEGVDRFHLRVNKQIAQNETVAIALAGPAATLNQSPGGEHPLSVGYAAADEVTAVRDDTLTRCRPDPPQGPSGVPDSSPEVTLMRDNAGASIRDVFAVAHQLPPSETGKIMIDSAIDQVVVNATAFSLNRHGQVTSLSLFKDETREGIEGKSTYWGRYSGRGPGYKKLVIMLARRLPAEAAEPREDLLFLLGWMFPAFLDLWNAFLLHLLYCLYILWLNRHLAHIRPVLLRVQSAQVERSLRLGHLRLPDTPAFRMFLEGTSCSVAALKALASQLTCKVPASTLYSSLAESGTSYIANYGVEGYCIVLCEPDPGLISHDPSLRVYVLAVLYVIELKAVVFEYVIEKKHRPRTIEALSLVRQEAEQLCDELGINGLLSQLVERLCTTAFTLSAYRSLGARRREYRAATAKGRGEVEALLHKKSMQMSRLVQIWNDAQPHAEGMPRSPERRAQMQTFIDRAKDALLRGLYAADIPCPIAMVIGDSKWCRWFLSRLFEKNLVRSAQATLPRNKGDSIIRGETAAEAKARYVNNGAKVGPLLANHWRTTRAAIAGDLARETQNVRSPVTVFAKLLSGKRNYLPYVNGTSKSARLHCSACGLNWVSPLHCSGHDCSIAGEEVTVTNGLSYDIIAYPADLYYSARVNIDLQLHLPDGTGSGYAYDFLPRIDYPPHVQHFLDQPTTKLALGLIFWKNGMSDLVPWQTISAVARLLAAPELQILADAYTLGAGDTRPIGFAFTSAAVTSVVAYISEVWKSAEYNTMLYYNICDHQSDGGDPCAFVTVRPETASAHTRHKRQHSLPSISSATSPCPVIPRPAFPMDLTQLMSSVDPNLACYEPAPAVEDFVLGSANHCSTLSAGTITSIWDLPTPFRLRLARATYDSHPENKNYLRFLEGNLERLLTTKFPVQ